jgi:hypothetical protein
MSMIGVVEKGYLPDGRPLFTCGCAGSDIDQFDFDLQADGNIPVWLAKLEVCFQLCGDCSRRHANAVDDPEVDPEEWVCPHVPCTGGERFKLESGILPSWVADAEGRGIPVKFCDECLEAYRRAQDSDGTAFTYAQAVARYRRTGNAYGNPSEFFWPREARQNP